MKLCEKLYASPYGNISSQEHAERNVDFNGKIRKVTIAIDDDISEKELTEIIKNKDFKKLKFEDNISKKLVDISFEIPGERTYNIYNCSKENLLKLLEKANVKLGNSLNLNDTDLINCIEIKDDLSLVNINKNTYGFVLKDSKEYKLLLKEKKEIEKAKKNKITPNTLKSGSIVDLSCFFDKKVQAQYLGKQEVCLLKDNKNRNKKRRN
jgi:hypothetical protein